jgi:hypothetical protein
VSVARETIRQLWRLGVRVQTDGERFRLTPPGVVPEDIRAQLRSNRGEIAALLTQLPAPDRCQICGESTGWDDGKLLANCTACALVAAERVFAKLGVEMPTTRGEANSESSLGPAPLVGC